MVTRELLDKISDRHPLSCEYETDARSVWPARWEEVFLAVEVPYSPAAVEELVRAAREYMVAESKDFIKCFCDLNAALAPFPESSAHTKINGAKMPPLSRPGNADRKGSETMKAMRVTGCSDCGDYYGCEHAKTSGGFSETCPLPDVPDDWDKTTWTPQQYNAKCREFVGKLRGVT